MNRIKELRQKAGLSQKELAEAIGTERTVIAKYEAGSRRVNVDNARKMGNLFGCSMEYLLGLPEAPGLDDASAVKAYHALDDRDRQIVDLILSRYMG